MKTKFVFNRKKRLNSANMAPIEVLVYFNRNKRVYRTTGVYCLPKYWDNKNQLLKKSCPNSDELNHKIFKFKNELEANILASSISGKYTDIKIEPEKVLFYDFFENRVMKVTNADLVKGTKFIYDRVLRYLKEYHSSDLPITDIDVLYIDNFNSFLRDVKKLKVNGRASLMNKVKRVFKVAVDDGIIEYSKNPFNKFKINKVDPEANSLTLDELSKIENLDMSLRPELDKARDMFLFSCYTSVRFGDLIKLSFENFEQLKDGRFRLTYVQEKLKHKSAKKIQWIVSDFWSGKVDAIILKYFDKYKEVRNVDSDFRRFWKYTNEFYNRQLKELQRFAEIKQPLHSHLARHTCITLLVNDFGLDITKAQMIAGHSKIEMTRKYLRVTERDLEAAAQKINWNK